MLGRCCLRFIRAFTFTLLVFILLFKCSSLYLIIDDVSDQLNVVAHDFKLRDPGIIFLLLSGHRICISHYGNEHVEENDIDQESGCKE